MANHHVNVLRFLGPADEVEAILARAASLGGYLSLPALVPPPAGATPAQSVATWGGGEPEEGMMPPVRYKEGGLSGASFTFSSKGAPFGLAEGVASATAATIVSLCSVDPMTGYAEARVFGMGPAWARVLTDDEVRAFLDPETEMADEGLLLDRLGSAAGQPIEERARDIPSVPAP